MIELLRALTAACWAFSRAMPELVALSKSYRLRQAEKHLEARNARTTDALIRGDVPVLDAELAELSRELAVALGDDAGLHDD